MSLASAPVTPALGPGTRHYTLLFLLIILALGLDTLLLFRSMKALTESRRRVRQGYEISQETIGLMSAINHVVLRQRRYLITQEPDLLRTFNLSNELALKGIEQIEAKVRDNPVQQRNFAQLRLDYENIIAAARREMDLVQNGGIDQARAEVIKGTTAAFMSDAWRTLQWIQQEEQRSLQIRVAEADRDSRTVLLTFSIAAGGILAMLVWIYLLIRRDVRRTRGQTLLLEQNVAHRTAQLQAINQELEAFCYSVSHDLRAPLRSISGFSEALIEDNADQLDPTGKDYLRRIMAASMRMGSLIDDLLDLSRVTRAEIENTSVDLGLLGRRIAIDLARNQFPAAEKIRIDEGMRATGDSRLLTIALTNLFENALKYSSREAEPRIEFFSLKLENEATAFAVRDNGVGFDMTYVDKLFTPFQRLHGSDEFSGTGIGLAIVQRIIARHGGRVWAESAVNQGATFYFTLGIHPERSGHE